MGAPIPAYMVMAYTDGGPNPCLYSYGIYRWGPQSLPILLWPIPMGAPIPAYIVMAYTDGAPIPAYIVTACTGGAPIPAYVFMAYTDGGPNPCLYSYGLYRCGPQSLPM